MDCRNSQKGILRDTRNIRTISLLAGFLLIISACREVGSSKTVELVFKGRCVNNKGQSIPTFVLSVERHQPEAKPNAITVTTNNGQYEAHFAVSVTESAGRILGAQSEKVSIKVGSSGYKSKSFVVTANQLLVGQANSLNVTLEPNS